MRDSAILAREKSVIMLSASARGSMGSFTAKKGEISQYTLSLSLSLFLSISLSLSKYDYLLVFPPFLKPSANIKTYFSIRFDYTEYRPNDKIE